MNACDEGEPQKEPGTVNLGGDAAQVKPDTGGEKEQPPEAQKGGYNGGYGQENWDQWTWYSFDDQWGWRDPWGVMSVELNQEGEIPVRKEEVPLDICNVVEELKRLTPTERVKYRDEIEKKLGQTHMRVRICPDSGAIVFIAPRDFAPHVELEESEASRRGVQYRVANKGLIPNLGQKVVEGLDINGNNTKSTWQIADVTKPLAGLIAVHVIYGAQGLSYKM